MGPRPDGRGKAGAGMDSLDGPAASMGPRPDGRGKGVGLVSVVRYPARVNGAAARRPRKGAPGGTWPRLARGVNGAAARRPRKGVQALPPLPRVARRQWGRGQTAAERRPAGHRVRGGARASMGPRPDGRGKTGRGRQGDRQRGASMGPRPDGRGKPDNARKGRKRGRASMGPRPDGRGKLRRGLDDDSACLASMGPRPDGRGKTDGNAYILALHPASMGPRPDGRGKAAPLRAFGPPPPRQWGRGQTAAESMSSTAITTAAVSVNGAAARRPRKARASPGAPGGRTASMGPRPDGRGKPAAARRHLIVSVRQWGRGQTAAERVAEDSDGVDHPGVNGAAARRPRKASGARKGARPPFASMGPRPDGRGKLPMRELPPLAGACVNGAAARRPRKDVEYLPLFTVALASMGPRPDGRGKEGAFTLMSGEAASVNGAAARRPRKGQRRGSAACATAGVNGAAARRPRKGIQGAQNARTVVASMGPRPDGRGKSAARVKDIRRAQRQWGRGQTAAESRSA